MTIGYSEQKKAAALLIYSGLISDAKAVETEKRSEVDAATKEVSRLEEAKNTVNRLTSLTLPEFGELSGILSEIISPAIALNDQGLSPVQQVALVLDARHHYSGQVTATDENTVANPLDGQPAFSLRYFDGARHGGGWKLDDQIGSGDEFLLEVDQTNAYLPVALGQTVRFDLDQRNEGDFLKVTII